jgi:ABC-type uncharacterized transport system fused permease/ATPase subunit
VFFVVLRAIGLVVFSLVLVLVGVGGQFIPLASSMEEKESLFRFYSSECSSTSLTSNFNLCY